MQEKCVESDQARMGGKRCGKRKPSTVSRAGAANLVFLRVLQESFSNPLHKHNEILPRSHFITFRGNVNTSGFLTVNDSNSVAHEKGNSLR